MILLSAVSCTFAVSEIDECAEETDGCAQTCVDTATSYTCSCNSGYRLATDGHACDGELLRNVRI